MFDGSKNRQRRPPMRLSIAVIDNFPKPRSAANQAVGSGGAGIEAALAMPTDLHGWQDLISALSTGVVALFTAALFWVGWRQIRDTKILQRAYLNVKPLGIVTSTTGDLIGHVAFKNVGKLPATEFVSVVMKTVVITPSGMRRPLLINTSPRT